MTQGMTTLLRYQHLVRLRDGSGFAFKLVMHKVARWLRIRSCARGARAHGDRREPAGRGGAPWPLC